MAMEFNEIAEVVEVDPMRRRKGLEGEDPSFSLSEFGKKTQDYITDEEISKLREDFPEFEIPKQREEFFKLREDIPELDIPKLREVLSELRENVSKQPKEDGEKRDEYGYTDLHGASFAGDVEKIEDLLTHGANIEARAGFGETPLMIAAYRGEREAVQTLLDKGADINARTNKGKTALICASQTGKNPEVIDDLIDAGADINATDIDGCTPLIWAAHRGNTDVVKILLEKGADIDIKAHKGNTASDLAKNKEIRDLLAQAKEEQAKNKEMAQNSVAENLEESEIPMEDFSSEISEIENKLDAVEETEELVDNGPPEQLEEEVTAETKIPSELNQTIPVEQIEKSETFEINPLYHQESFMPLQQSNTVSEKQTEAISQDSVFRTSTIFNPYQEREEEKNTSKQSETGKEGKVSAPKRPRSREEFFKQMEEARKRFEEETKKMEENFEKNVEAMHSNFGQSSLKETLANGQQGNSDNNSSAQQTFENNSVDVEVPSILKGKETDMKDDGVPTVPPAILTEKGDYSLTSKNQDVNITVTSSILKNKGRG